MKVVLEVQDQPSNVKKVTVRHDIVIGRGADCNLRLSAPQVSRRHCFLRIGTEGVFISDLDSSNGTTLNGEKLVSGQRYRLDDGTVLAVGPVQFVARVEAEVEVAEMLDVAVSGHQTAGNSAAEFDDSQTDRNFGATVAGGMPEDADDLINFAIEQSGPVANEDAPTADCVLGDSVGLGGSNKPVPNDSPAKPAEDDGPAVFSDVDADVRSANDSGADVSNSDGT